MQQNCVGSPVTTCQLKKNVDFDLIEALERNKQTEFEFRECLSQLRTGFWSHDEQIQECATTDYVSERIQQIEHAMRQCFNECLAQLEDQQASFEQAFQDMNKKYQLLRQFTEEKQNEPLVTDAAFCELQKDLREQTSTAELQHRRLSAIELKFSVLEAKAGVIEELIKQQVSNRCNDCMLRSDDRLQQVTKFLPKLEECCAAQRVLEHQMKGVLTQVREGESRMHNLELHYNAALDQSARVAEFSADEMTPTVEAKVCETSGPNLPVDDTGNLSAHIDQLKEECSRCGECLKADVANLENSFGIHEKQVTAQLEDVTNRIRSAQGCAVKATENQQRLQVSMENARADLTSQDQRLNEVCVRLGILVDSVQEIKEKQEKH